MNEKYSEKIYNDSLKKIVIKCKLCNKTCDTDDQLDVHNKSKNHLKKLTAKQTEVNFVSLNCKSGNSSCPYHCEICSVDCNTLEQLESHNRGKSHIKKSLKNDYKSYQCDETPLQNKSFNEASQVSTKKNIDLVKPNETQSINVNEINEPSEIISPSILNLLKPLIEGNYITCSLCNVSMNTNEQYALHCHGTKHTKKLRSYNIPESLVSKKDLYDDECINCKVCNITIHKNNKDSHENGKIHRDNLFKSKTEDVTEQTVCKTDLSEELKNLKLMKLEPRKYQLEIFKKANGKDCVIFLPTGTGKTFIAAMLILKMLEENPFHRVAFLVDKVLLVMQQSDSFKQQFEDICLKRFDSKNETVNRKLRLIGLASDFVDSVHNVSIREHDVIIATADLFKNNLIKQRIYWTDFCLVALDEAHHCVKEHPYNRLLFEYHLYPQHVRVNQNDLLNRSDIQSPPAVIECELEKWKIRRCMIIGLTASPAGELDFDKTYELLKMLLHSLGDVSVVTVTENIDDLNEYTSLTNIESRIVNYGESETELRKLISNNFVFLLKKFERLVNGIGNGLILSPNTKLTIEEISNLKNQLSGFIVDLQNIEKSILNHILALVEIIEAIDNIGYTIAKKKFDEIISNDNEKVWFNNNILNFEKSSEEFRSHHQEEETSSIISEIVKECRALQNENRTILILVKERKDAREYKDLIEKEYKDFKCQLLVGHGGKGTRGKNKGMSVGKQKKALDFIRKEESLIIIATSVADEGIDLPQCDLVIIVNPPTSVQALVQIRGRARKKTSKLLMLCRDEKFIESLNELKKKEENINEAIKKLISENNP